MDASGRYGGVRCVPQGRSRGEGSAMGSRRQHRVLRRARWLVAAVFGIVALGGLPGAVSADGPDPVLLVHGWQGSPSTWDDMIGAFAREGRRAKAITLSGQD